MIVIKDRCSVCGSKFKMRAENVQHQYIEAAYESWAVIHRHRERQEPAHSLAEYRSEVAP
jgi:hypothetical protein